MMGGAHHTILINLYIYLVVNLFGTLNIYNLTPNIIYIHIHHVIERVLFK